MYLDLFLPFSETSDTSFDTSLFGMPTLQFPPNWSFNNKFEVYLNVIKLIQLFVVLERVIRTIIIRPSKLKNWEIINSLRL